MDMTGEYRIPAPRQRVWEALNDPEILKAAIPGCEELTKVGDNDLEARVKAKVGPVSATFTGKVQLSDIDPPNGYTIGGEGSGGVAGFAKGGAKVRLLEAEGGATKLAYDVTAQVGGKIAQLGARLIDSTAKQLADQFFDRFVHQVTAREAPAAALAPPPLPAATGLSVLDLIPREPMGLPRAAWIGIAIQLVIMVLLFGTYLR